MPVIAVINRKGGSGKSTLATHLAAHYASRGVPVMLGDVDRQQSTQTWLRLRHSQPVPGRSPIVGWAIDPRNVLRPPPGISHVVLDTPGGLRGFDLARVVAFADVIVLPVCNSVFDRDSSAACVAELTTLPRVAHGRCKIAIVGMRLDSRTGGAQTLHDWARALELPFIGALREAQAYVRCIERGLTLFDLPAAKTLADMAQWQPILEWLDAALRAVPRLSPNKANPSVQRDATPAPPAHAEGTLPVRVVAPSRLGGPVQRIALEPLTPGRHQDAATPVDRLAPAPIAAPLQAARREARSRFHWLSMPQFLRSRDLRRRAPAG